MKRQAEGVSLQKEGAEQPETNGSKRIKLLNNEASEENMRMDSTEEKSIMDASLSESSHNHSHKDHSPSISNNNSGSEHIDGTDDSSPNTNENGNFNHLENNCNGSCDEAVVKVSASDSGIVSELYHSKSHGNPVIYSEENQEEEGLPPPVLNHCDHDIHNSESTDSFQSEGFDASMSTQGSSNEASEKHLCQEQNDNQEKESSVEPDLKSNTVDVDNLTLSHLKITELEGHTDDVLAVAADEDYVLSASADTTVRVWSTERKSAVSTFSGHSNSITAVLLLNPSQSKTLKKKMSLTKVSRIAITGSLDCNIKFWSVLEGKELASVYTYNGITCLGYLESESLVVVGTEGGKLELWDVASLEVKKSERAHDDAVTDIKVKDNYIYSVSTDGTAKVWVYEDEDVYPVYSRKRKEISSDNNAGFKPAQWKTLAVSDDVMYLGDCTSNVKVLQWNAGHLRLFKNQIEAQGVCECVIAEKNMLFSTCYDSSSDTGGVNVWKIPEMAYVCTLTNTGGYIRSLAATQKDNLLQIVCGGNKLCIWEFDFSKPPSSEDEGNIRELETLGLQIDEKPVHIKSNTNSNSNPDAANSSNRWCSVM